MKTISKVSRNKIKLQNVASNTEKEKVTEIRRIDAEQRKASKGIQSYYNEKRFFTDKFKSNWFIHVEDYEDICTNWDVSEIDKVSFVRFSLFNESDARQYYEWIVKRSRDAEYSIKWKSLVELYTSR